MRRTALLTTGCIFVVLGATARPAPDKSGAPATVTPVVPRVRAEVQPLIEKHLAEQQARTLKELADRSGRYPALFKTALVRKGLSDPWAGMTELEQHGLGLAAAARTGLAGLGSLVDRLGAAIGKPPGEVVTVPRGQLTTLEEHAAYLIAVLDKARELRDAALAKLSPEERDFAFTQPPYLIASFGPQLSFSPKTKTVLLNDRAFCTLIQEHCDWAKMAGAARVLAALAEPEYLASLKKVLGDARPIADTVPGVTGDILYKKETRHGLILFGGKGRNTYALKRPAAVIVDLGGDDSYKGMVASSFDLDHPNSVVIDLDGDDTYEGDDFGVATGRLGVGLLIDMAGKDTYKLAQGSGGTGFGGIGILCDAAGDDVYEGTRWTQGAAVAGIGLLFDLAGDDRYTSWGFAIGIGGPCGQAGAVIDVAGNDSYQCGKKYPSGYNESDAPNARPGDPAFQWDCFGMGMGLGRRVVPPTVASDAFSLAGGLGVVIDLEGNDRYESSNFSQACGYFFGIGLNLDLAGNDVHSGARYSFASGAHYGMGLCIDYSGRDTWTTTGPTYACGCAWDHSAFLCIDAGQEGDIYDLERSSGLGSGDHGGWGVFADLGGKDRYRVGGGMGSASDKGLGVFYDRAGLDDYDGAKHLPSRPANGKTDVNPAGGLFVDREDR